MYSRLLEIFKPHQVKFNEPMKNHTTFKIGGPADIMILPASVTDLQKALVICHQDNLPVFIIGLGSNLLIKDGGIRGVVIKIGNNLRNCEVNDTHIYAEAGIRLSELAHCAAAHNLSGLEFAEGIPGSLGGAIVMNAGAYGSEMKDVIESVQAFTPDGTIQTFQKDDLHQSYRDSIFQHNNYTVVSARLKLTYEDKEKIQATMKELAYKRRERQPVEYPSAGSVFRRPEGIYVGPLIEKAGLKGFHIGDAEVSNKHAGFIINKGNATAREVLDLINYIKKEASRQYDVNLEPEITIMGED